MAVYCCKDDKITRPFYPRGRLLAQVTRHHPPIEGQDSPIMTHFIRESDVVRRHQWLDYWRSCPCPTKGIRRSRTAGLERTFAVRNEYLTRRIHRKLFAMKLPLYVSGPARGYCCYGTRRSSDKEFYFAIKRNGPGFRSHAAGSKRNPKSTCPGNGTILDSQGRKNEKQIWGTRRLVRLKWHHGRPARWPDYFPHPGNLRPSWFHAGLWTTQPTNLAERRLAKERPVKSQFDPARSYGDTVC